MGSVFCGRLFKFGYSGTPNPFANQQEKPRKVFNPGHHEVYERRTRIDTRPVAWFALTMLEPKSQVIQKHQTGSQTPSVCSSEGQQRYGPYPVPGILAR